jgi:mono/diheme cytochrome c family protein
MDGRALKGSDLAKASDLTDPRGWTFGQTDGHLFIAIKDGTKGQMPGFAAKLKDDQIWKIVNFIRSIGPKDKRPELVETAQ